MDPRNVTLAVIGKRVQAGFKVFPGERYSNGEAARPYFSFLEKEKSLAGKLAGKPDGAG